MKRLSILIPVFNEAQVLKSFHSRLIQALEGETEIEILYVDDGSTDGTSEILADLANRESVRVLNHETNQGQQQALITGYDNAVGQLIVTLDADGQDPPELISELVKRQQETGASIVWTRRKSRDGEHWWKLVTAKCFYKIMGTTGEGDFRLITHDVWQEIRGEAILTPYLRGVFTYASGRHETLLFDRQARMEGEGKYTVAKMLQLAWHGGQYRLKRFIHSFIRSFITERVSRC